MTNAPLDTARTQLFSTGKTIVFSSRHDPRFAYCLYVPSRQEGRPPGLIVSVHGSGRNFMDYRDRFSEFAERENMVVLAPLFPAGVAGDGNVDGYKYLIEGGIRYDRVLLDMVEEVAERTGCEAGRFLIFGYSGGGHFVHRFLLIHPDRLLAASIGAPGQVTLLDETADWWVGVRDLETLFGQPLDLAALRRVAVQMVIGDADTETWEITHAPGSRYWRAEAMRAGADRLERLASLRDSFRAAGVAVEFATMPGVKHAGAPAVPIAADFFARCLAGARQAA